MKGKLFILTVFLLASFMQAEAQVDRKDVRKGNRDFRRENFREAEIDYRKALVKDSMSVAANYNLAGTLYREGDYAQAQQTLERIRDLVKGSPYEADYYFNLGDVSIQQKNWQLAVDSFRESLILRPEDLEAKESYIYAKKMLDEQKQNQQNQQNQNNNQNQDQNKDDRNKDDREQDQDKNEDRQPPKEQPKQEQQQQPKISPQAAQQMLQAIQAKEKETQEKVNKDKAEALKARQKEKNW